MDPIIIIPARYKSSRLEGKPLKKILNKEMILRVAETCQKVVKKKNLFVATDDKRIYKKAIQNNFNAVMTPSNLKTGTDRVAYVAKLKKSPMIINVQGDEPLIKASDIKKVINCKKKFPDHVICGFALIKDKKEITNENVIKVAKTKKNDLIYFSRSKIPCSKKKDSKVNYFKQVCVYAFTNNQLKKYLKSGRSYLDKIEDIELLRFLDLGIKIKLVKISSTTAVDVHEDIKKVERILKSK
ncbi:MAG: 3-deoxy-manno-octulosonate cytidylyltransferase [Candidatus Pelagibacter sp.]|nr:3-deoxy-manno-octulosonate cytidylyltransferase [Candidatus Pelagibacter sp.]|tara:strand:- start:8542 stop:9264 length:723 start_codon:yes stop_codon:yes gene_type:complete